MPSIEDVVQTQLSGPLNAQWLVALREAVPWALGEYAVRLLDCEAIPTRGDWNRLGDPLFRAQVVEQSPTLLVRCAELLEGQLQSLRQAIIDALFESDNAEPEGETDLVHRTARVHRLERQACLMLRCVGPK